MFQAAHLQNKKDLNLLVAEWGDKPGHGSCKQKWGRNFLTTLGIYSNGSGDLRSGGEGWRSSWDRSLYQFSLHLVISTKQPAFGLQLP